MTSCITHLKIVSAPDANTPNLMIDVEREKNHLQIFNTRMTLVELMIGRKVQFWWISRWPMNLAGDEKGL
jgi:hypothetical protein